MHIMNLIAFYLDVIVYMSRHIKKVTVLYNVLVCINYVRDHPLIQWNAGNINKFIEILLMRVRECYNIS